MRLLHADGVVENLPTATQDPDPSTALYHPVRRSGGHPSFGRRGAGGISDLGLRISDLGVFVHVFKYDPALVLEVETRDSVLGAVDRVGVFLLEEFRRIEDGGEDVLQRYRAAGGVVVVVALD